MAATEPLGEAEPTWRAAVAAELRRIEERCSKAADGQGEAVRLWRTAHLLLASAAALASGAAGATVLATDRCPALAGVLALVAAVLTGAAGVLGPARRQAGAAEAAKAYRSVQAQAHRARQVDLPGQSFAPARRALGDLTDHWHAANRRAAPVPRLALRRVRPDAYALRPCRQPVEWTADVVRVFSVARPIADRLPLL